VAIGTGNGASRFFYGGLRGPQPNAPPPELSPPAAVTGRDLTGAVRDVPRRDATEAEGSGLAGPQTELPFRVPAPESSTLTLPYPPDPPRTANPNFRFAGAAKGNRSCKLFE